MINNKTITNNYKTYSILFGIILVILLCLSRLIGLLRNARNVPYNLSLLLFISLTVLCIIFLIVIIQLLRNKSLTSSTIIQKIQQSYIDLSYYLFLNSQYKDQINNFFVRLIDLLYRKPNLKYYIFTITKVIQLILPITLFIETFLIHKVQYFFYFSPLMLIPIIFSLLLFNINNLYKINSDNIQETIIIYHYVKNPNIEHKVDEDGTIVLESKNPERFNDDFNIFVDIARFQKTHSKKDITLNEHLYLIYLQENNLLSYSFTTKERIRDSFIYQNKIFFNDDDRNTYFRKFLRLHKEKLFDSIEKKILLCKKIFYYNLHFNHLNVKYDKKINLLSLTIYLISWLYILVISLPSLHLLPFEEVFLNNFQDIIEPFSGNNLF